MRATIVFIVLFSAAFARNAPEADTRSGDTRSNNQSQTLTLEEALLLAGELNPRLKVAAALVESADAAAVTAKARPNPTVAFGTLGRQRALIDGSAPGMIHGFSITQPLELPNLRQTRVHAAEAGRESTRYAVAEVRLAVRGMVKQAFYEALRRKNEVELARGNLRLVEDLLRRIEIQVKVGEAARLELARAEAEVAAARIQVQSSELRRAAALSALHAAVGTEMGEVELAGGPEPGHALPALESLRSEVLSAHPSVALADSETRRAAAHVRYQRSQRMPQPSVWADVFRQPDVAQYRYGISVDLPIWSRREGPIAEAVAAEHQARAMAMQRRLELSAMLDRAYRLYEIASRQVEMFEAGTLRAAEVALQSAETAFRFGERSIIEVLDAQRVLRASRQDYLNAQFDRQQALVELEQMRGSDFGGNRP